MTWSILGEFAKCFHHTELVDVVHNHAPMHCMSEEDSRNCSVFFVDPAIAKLHHYKGLLWQLYLESYVNYFRVLCWDSSGQVPWVQGQPGQRPQHGQVWAHGQTERH